jgi:hypothetical protein
LASSSTQTEADMVNTTANTHRLRVNPGAPVSPEAMASDSASAASHPATPDRTVAAHERAIPSSRPDSQAIPRITGSETSRSQASFASISPP